MNLIKKTDVTVTASGSAGWEAIKNKKKTLIFGDSWYSNIHGCFKVNSNTTNNEINDFINQEFKQNNFKSDLDNILSQTHQGVANLDYVEIYGLEKFNPKVNSEEVTKNILNFIKKKN